jgi:hypothetical protein
VGSREDPIFQTLGARKKRGRLPMESPPWLPRGGGPPRSGLGHWHLILKVTAESPRMFSSRPGNAPAVTPVDRFPASMSAQVPGVPSVDPDKELLASGLVVSLLRSWIVVPACPVPIRRAKCASPDEASNGVASAGQGFGLQLVVVVMRRRICFSLRCMPPAGNVPLPVTWIGLLHTPVCGCAALPSSRTAAETVPSGPVKVAVQVVSPSNSGSSLSWLLL